MAVGFYPTAVSQCRINLSKQKAAKACQQNYPATGAMVHMENLQFFSIYGYMI
jgi:hypothetical protein